MCICFRSAVYLCVVGMPSVGAEKVKKKRGFLNKTKSMSVESATSHGSDKLQHAESAIFTQPAQPGGVCIVKIDCQLIMIGKARL